MSQSWTCNKPRPVANLKIISPWLVFRTSQGPSEVRAWEDCKEGCHSCHVTVRYQFTNKTYSILSVFAHLYATMNSVNSALHRSTLVFPQWIHALLHVHLYSVHTTYMAIQHWQVMTLHGKQTWGDTFHTIHACFTFHKCHTFHACHTCHNCHTYNIISHV